jgi:glycosyltransferase involved in cell wall biosynthesis
MSLHRSEGFGLPIAEAMLLGTPVIVTNWSGNVDFCNEGNSYLVDADMIPVKSEHPEFRKLGTLKWANPRVTHAAAMLKKLYDDPENARIVGMRGKNESLAFFSKNLYDSALESLKSR